MIPVIGMSLISGINHTPSFSLIDEITNKAQPITLADTNQRTATGPGTPTKDPQSTGSSFTFTLQAAGNTSAGVYNEEGVLIRTLWSNVHYDEGEHTGSWNGKDDLGVKIAVGKYNVRVLTGNVKYTWEGVVGNTSESFTGPSVIHNLRTIHDMAFNGTTGYQAVGYSEIDPPALKFNTSRPQAKQIIPGIQLMFDFVVTDGTNVYWSACNPMAQTNTFLYVTKTSDDSQVKLQKSIAYTKVATFTYHAVNYINQINSDITGLAVQKTGPLLVVARAGINRLDVLNKSTGAVIKTITTYKAPKNLAFDKDNNLWMLYKKNNISAIEKFQINVSGAMSSLKVSLLGLVDPEAFDVSPDNLTVAVADAGTSQQVKGFSIANGNPQWVLGQAGGYAKSTGIANDKFDFDGPYEKLPTFVAYQPDGSFWVEDPGNGRTQHFSANRGYMNNIVYRPMSYAANVNPSNPTQLFSDFLEYRINYDKPLAASNGSWTLVRNWRQAIPAVLRSQYYGMKPVTVSGHTYALFYKGIDYPKYIAVYEILASGKVRDTGIKIKEDDTNYYPDGTNTLLESTRLYPDGSLYSNSRKVNAKPLIWVKNDLTGISANGNPKWDAAKLLVSTPPVKSGDPVYQGNFLTNRAGEITTSGILVSFAAGVPPATSDTYHLGGIRVSDGKWMWKTSMSTVLSYQGAFPSDGGYDIGNGVKNAGSVAMAYGNNIFWGYYGEFWKNSQTNKWNHYNDDGLMVGQFGVANAQKIPAQAGMSGNAFSATMVKGPDGNAYLYQNDESQHGGVHRWKITGLETIQEQTVQFIPPDTDPGKGSLPNNGVNAKVIDLMENLPRRSTLINGRYGWSRTPADQILVDPYSNYWSAATSVKTSGMNTSPDVYVVYRQATKSSPTVMSVKRDLENNIAVGSWRLQGNISYANSWPNGDKFAFGHDGEGGQFLEVLDDQNKIIARFSPRINYDTGIVSIYGNDAVAATGTRAAITPIISTIRPFYIQSTRDGKITFQYANYPPVTADVLDKGSRWQKPKTLRLYFWTGASGAKGNNSDRQIDLSNLTFSTTQEAGNTM